MDKNNLTFPVNTLETSHAEDLDAAHALLFLGEQNHCQHAQSENSLCLSATSIDYGVHQEGSLREEGPFPHLYSPQ